MFITNGQQSAQKPCDDPYNFQCHKRRMLILNILQMQISFVGNSNFIIFTQGKEGRILGQ